MLTTIYNDLLAYLNEEDIKQNEPLSNHTYTKTGGIADIMVLPRTYREVQDVFRYSQSHSIPLTYFGNGSNLIIRDGGIRGITILFENLNSLHYVNGFVVAQSGAPIIDVSYFALFHQQTGLEFACGIPGTVGGALYMNAGAYGGEISDVLAEALILKPNGELKRISAEDLGLGYRTSAIPSLGYIVLEATFELRAGDKDLIQAQMADLTLKRETKQPLEFPSCGSVFKRPPGYFAGKLIQNSHLQGQQIGGAQVSQKHAGFMINTGDATATDYLDLINYVQNSVYDHFNVQLETEVKIIGDHNDSQITQNRKPLI